MHLSNTLQTFAGYLEYVVWVCTYCTYLCTLPLSLLCLILSLKRVTNCRKLQYIMWVKRFVNYTIWLLRTIIYFMKFDVLVRGRVRLWITFNLWRYKSSLVVEWCVRSENAKYLRDVTCERFKVWPLQNDLCEISSSSIYIWQILKSYSTSLSATSYCTLPLHFILHSHMWQWFEWKSHWIIIWCT